MLQRFHTYLTPNPPWPPPAFSMINTLPQSRSLGTSNELHSHIIVTQSPWFSSGDTFVFLYRLGLDKCIMTHIYHYRVMQNTLIHVDFLCALPLHLIPSPNLSYHCGLPFPNCHLIRVTNMLLFFSVVFFHLVTCICFLRAFHDLIAHFFQC